LQTNRLQAADGGVLPQQQPPLLAEHINDSFSHVSVVPLNIIRIPTPAIIDLFNTQQVVSLKLVNINYLYCRMQMKSYLLGQGVFHFVDGSMSCPPSHVSDSFVGSSLTIDPSFIHWK
jgi:hypothetical protein